MKNFYLVFLSFFIVLFVGCGEKTTALNHFENEPRSAAAIQYTKKRDIIYKKDPAAMIFATYLNKIDENYDSEESNSFIIGFHLVNSDNHDLSSSGFKLTIDNKEPNNISELSKESDYLKYIPLKNSWANYYLVSLDNNKKSTKINIKLTHPVLGQASLDFQK